MGNGISPLSAQSSFPAIDKAFAQIMLFYLPINEAAKEKTK